MTIAEINALLYLPASLPRRDASDAFVARWCTGYKIETAERVFRVREDAPEQTPMHRTP